MALIYSIIDYFRFRFHIENDELIVKSGVFRRKTLNIPFDRIQSVDFKRNVVHQFLKVVSVKIDTAGTKGNELEFDAMEIDEAEAFRDMIMGSKKGEEVLANVDGASDENFVETSIPALPPQVILNLSWKDLLKVGVSSNHLRTAFIIIVFFITIADDLDQFLGVNVFDEFDKSSLYLKLITFIIAIAAIPFFILVSFIVSLFGSVIRYYNLTFWYVLGKFKVVSGLFTRNEKTIQQHKIQLVKWRTTPLQEIFGMFKMNIYQTTGAESEQATSLEIPGCYQEQVDKTLEFVSPGVTSAIFKTHSIHRSYVMWLVIVFGLLPAVGAGIYSYYTNGIFSWLLIGIFPLAIIMGQQFQKKRKILLHPEYLISESGIFGKTSKLIEWYKVQHVTLTSSPRQRRRNVRTLYINTAGGEIMVPYIDKRVAEDTRDYILYKIESTEKNWM